MLRSEAAQSVLVIAPGQLGERLSGPEIRAVRLAEALSAEYLVTLMAPDSGRDAHGEIPVVPFSRGALLREARSHDVLLAAAVPPFALLLKRWLGIVIVADLYDPVELEMGTLKAGASRARGTARAGRRLQLRYADLVLCAGDRQRDLLESELDTLEGAFRPEVLMVPFGIDEQPVPVQSAPFRDHFGQIEADDKIVLWWGSLWRWLDPETAIRAFASIAFSRPEVKLIFTSGRAPNQNAERHSVVQEAVDLAHRLEVLNRNVFFFDEWVSFDRRGEYLQEADLGLTLHGDTEEAPLAARARYMDYLWAGLPCVLAAGDETADRFASGGFASLVEPHSPEETADVILAMLDRESQARARKAGAELGSAHLWARLAAPLLAALKEEECTRSRRRSSTSPFRIASYYSRRIVDLSSRAVRTD